MFGYLCNFIGVTNRKIFKAGGHGFFMKISRDEKAKAGIYGGNILFNPLANGINDLTGSKIDLTFANPVMAGVYTGLDVLGLMSPKFQNHKVSRLAKIAGLGWYIVKMGAKGWGFVHGDYTLADNLLFDASMAYQLANDSLDNYSKPDTDLLDDITGFFKGREGSDTNNKSFWAKMRDIRNKRTAPSP